VTERVTWGWHRLDSRGVRRTVDAVGVVAGDLVLDVGAGDGVITRELLARGASVVAVELHPRRAADLRAAFRGERVVVVQADAADLRLPRRPFKVAANPPFGITTALLRRLTSARSNLDCAGVVVPTWAAGRWTACRGGGRAASRQVFRFESGGRIPAGAFTPRAPRDAALLLITRQAPSLRSHR
jgi:23S rRNA (adenine-N6)-dimethyltransferase